MVWKYRKGPISRKGFPDGNLRIGYVWESAIQGHAPNLESQLADVRDCHKIFHDKITFESCVLSPRTKFAEMCQFLRDGDTVVVHCISSLGTSMLEITDNVLSLMSDRCYLQIPGYKIDTTNPETCEIMVGVFQGLAMVEEQGLGVDSHKSWIRRTCS